VFTKPITALSGPLNTGARYSGSVEVRLVEVLKTIANQSGFVLLTAKVHGGDHVHVFVFAPLALCIPEIVRVLKCNSVKLLFEEFL
jgi:REP element-mobilizing transposase RayT